MNEQITHSLRVRISLLGRLLGRSLRTISTSTRFFLDVPIGWNFLNTNLEEGNSRDKPSMDVCPDIRLDVRSDTRVVEDEVAPGTFSGAKPDPCKGPLPDLVDTREVLGTSGWSCDLVQGCVWIWFEVAGTEEKEPPTKEFDPWVCEVDSLGFDPYWRVDLAVRPPSISLKKSLDAFSAALNVSVS